MKTAVRSVLAKMEEFVIPSQESASVQMAISVMTVREVSAIPFVIFLKEAFYSSAIIIVSLS